MSEGRTRRYGASHIVREYQACPTVPDHKAGSVAHQAREDAMDLCMDVRDLDPRQLWGRLNLWQQEDPYRLIAACVALSAMVPVDTSVGELLAWTDQMREEAA